MLWYYIFSFNSIIYVFQYYQKLKNIIWFNKYKFDLITSFLWSTWLDHFLIFIKGKNTTAIGTGIFEYFFQIFISQFFTKTIHKNFEILSRDLPIIIFIKNLKWFSHQSFLLLIFNRLTHERQKLHKINCTTSIFINFINHIF